MVKTKDPRGIEEMTTFQIATLGFYAIQSLIGLAQCALILMGLRQMSRASELREGDSARRHEESMTALRALIERTAK